MRRSLIAAGLVILLGPVNVPAQPYDFSEVDAAVEQFLLSSFATGVGLIITTPQQDVYERSYGNAVDGEIVTLLSASKMPSTTAILTLVAEGRLGLDDRVGNYLEDWPTGKQAITIRQCLSCTAGFRLIPPKQGNKTLAEQVAAIAEQPLLYAPGDLFSYSGSGFQVAGRVAEVISGQPWEEFYRDRMVVPLKLETYDVGGPEGLTLAAGAESNLKDYAKILRLHLNNGRVPGGPPVLTQALALEMRRDQVGERRMLARLYPFGFRYGLSWWITVPKSRTEPFVFSDQGASGATPWINTDLHYGAFLYLKGFSQNYLAAARLWTDVSGAIDEQFENP
jgi:serine-type D-Ala-D-Ala carboxypeptidase/endopeptidase